MRYEDLPPWLREGLQTQWPTMARVSQDVMSDPYWGTGLAGGSTKLVPGRGVSMIKALHNQTGREVGQLGFRQAPGRGGRLLDIKVDPSVRGQGYGRELIERFEQEMGPQMRDTGFAGTISNSPGFWEKLADRWRDLPIGQGIRQSLNWY